MRIPFAEVQAESPGVPATAPQVDTRIPAMAAAGAGALTETLGAGLEKIGVVVDKLNQARETVQVSNAATDAAGQLQDARLELEKDPDVAGRAAKFQAKADEIRQKQLENMGGRAGNEFTMRFNQLYKPIELDVKQAARGEEIQQHKVDLSDSLEKMANQAVFAKTAVEREAIQAEADKQIIQAVNTGYLKASDAASVKRAYLSKVDGALAAEQVRLNPEGAVATLGDPNAYPYLDAAQRIHLRTQATARLESLNAQGRAEARLDAAEFTATLRESIATGAPMASEQEYKAVLLKVGPNSPQGVRLQHQWDLTNKAIAASAGKSPSEIQAEIDRLQGGTTPAISDQLAAVQSSVGKTLQTQGIDLGSRITSATRTETQNARAGGAGDSQHLHGNALDISLAGLSQDQQQKVIEQFLSDPRVKGFGYYADHIHVDTRPGSAVSWGVDKAPAWVSERVNQWQGGGNLGAADKAMTLTPQEKNLWLHHSDNLAEGGVKQPGGATSTLLATTVGIGDKTYVLPTVWDNKVVSVDEAVTRATAEGLDNFPSYATQAEAKARYDQLHGFLEKDIGAGGTPTADELRQAHALHQIMARKILERDRDPKLHADVDQFISVLSQADRGKPLASEDDFKKLVERAGGPDTPMGVRLTRAWKLASNVAADATKDIPELQARVDQLREGKPTAEQLAQATHLEQILRHKEELRAADPQLRLDIQAFLETVKSGMADGKLPSQQAYEQLLDRAGGPATATGTHLMRAWSDANAVAHDVTSLSLPELANAVNQLRQGGASVDDLERSHALGLALAAKLEARDKDPAAYVAKTYATIGEQLAAAEKMGASNDAVQQAQAADMRRNGWAAMIDAQHREGVPENKIALLTKPTLEAIKGSLLTSDPQGRATQMENLRTQFGDVWPIVQRQMWEGKPAPPDLEVMGNLPNDDSGRMARQVVGEAFKIKDGEAKDQLGGQRTTAIADETRRQTADMAASMAQAPDGARFIATYQETVRKVAELYAIRGQANDADAVRRAADTVFYEHYVLADAVNGVSVRIPKLNGVPTVDPGDVRTLQRTIIGALPQMDLLLPTLPGVSDAQRKDMYLHNIRSQGYWMTTADERGMKLIAGPGLPVKFADGSDVVVPFDSVAGAAHQRSAQDAAELRRIYRGYEASQEPAPGEQGPGTVRLPPVGVQRYLNPPPMVAP